MRMHTCSEVIGFTRELEDISAKFYEGLSQKFDEREEVFLSFVKENKKYSSDVQRTYYSVISDAIEGCFAFDIDPDEYAFQIKLPENVGFAETLRRAVEIEEKIIKFYSDAAEQSKSLMADIPMAFRLIAKKKGNRVSMLKSLLEGA